MSRLQSCNQCGAQFDVSSFAPGQQFSCGSCGAILTAHQVAGSGAAGSAAAGPRTPAVQGRAPGSRGGGTPRRTPGSSRKPGGTAPTRAGQDRTARRGTARGTAAGGGKRGPQYRPPERGQKAKTPARGAGRGSARRSSGRRVEREPYERDERKKNPALLYAVGALVVAVVLVLVVVGGGSDDGSSDTMAAGDGTHATQGGGADEPAKEPDTIASVRTEMRENAPHRPREYHTYADRFLKVGGEEGKQEAEALYEELITQVDKHDQVARKYLGYTDFQAEILGTVLEPDGDPIPEAVFNRRGYPFLDAVVEFNHKRWLTDPDEIELAKKAVAEMREHVRKLETDHQYRAADQIRANIAQDPLLAPYNYETRWAAPYLICYSSKDRLSEFELLNEPDYKKRKKMREEMRQKRKEWTRVLDEKALLYTQLYKEWMRRFKDRFELKDLYDEYGGRPDYGSYKSYKDGVPLVIWIFNDREAFQNYHSKVKKEYIPAFAAGYFMPTTTWIYLYDETDTQADRVFEINKNLHEGTHQLEHWFTMQKNKWRKPHNTQTAFSEGIAEYLGAVEMDIHRKLKWTGVNQTRLGLMKSQADRLKQRDQEYPLFPIERLTWSSSYSQIAQWAIGHFPVIQDMNGAMFYFYQQAWASTYFFLNFENGKYKDRYMQFFDAVLSQETGTTAGQDVFKRIFKIRDEEDWEELEEDWKKFVFDDLMKRTVPTYKCPKRDEWPDGK